MRSSSRLKMSQVSALELLLGYDDTSVPNRVIGWITLIKLARGRVPRVVEVFHKTAK